MTGVSVQYAFGIRENTPGLRLYTHLSVSVWADNTRYSLSGFHYHVYNHEFVPFEKKKKKKSSTQRAHVHKLQRRKKAQHAGDAAEPKMGEESLSSVA